MNNDTPRTDAAIKDVLQTGQHQKVKAEFARQLESENQFLAASRRKLIEENSRLRDELSALTAINEHLRRKSV